MDIHNRKIGGFVSLFRTAIDTPSKRKEESMEEQSGINGISQQRKDAMIHDLILVVKSAMTKVNGREQLWCDIIANSEKQIRRVIESNIK